MTPNPRPYFAALAIALAVGACQPAPTAAATYAPNTTTTEARKQEPAPDPCADYHDLEQGAGTPTRQHAFNHLDARGYARWRAACVYRWGTVEWTCLEQLWDEESSWKTTAGRPSSSYGIPQSYPGDKMAAAGADWLTNPRTQIRWGLAYIAGRYQRPTRATMRGAPCHAGY